MSYGLFICHDQVDDQDDFDQVDDQDAAELGRLLVVNLVKIVLVVNLVVVDEEPISHDPYISQCTSVL